MNAYLARLQAYMNHMADRYFKDDRPIFEIVLFEHPCKELLFSKKGKQVSSGLPDANLNHMGFYYELGQAIQAMHENRLDIHEAVYHAGFILCRYPGLYYSATTDSRIYFLWDESKKGFYEAEEPELFRHVAY